MAYRIMPKSIYKKFLQRIKVYRISTSLILFFTFVLSLLVIFSSIEYSNLQKYAVDRDSVDSSENRDVFYDDGSLEQKVDLYRKAILKKSFAEFELEFHKNLSLGDLEPI